ncbi:olfactory receptor 5V1-like isoform X1 [Rhineura floridana]|uniref:olfactory receptor 5V1-like isoform X1 n=3 Tax=Rhineura floridana TaxID=261503 RepID=UPI002AC82064|nr:olfactory receptor 5V1-like isoform X1 [Rhineura floridana]
MSFIFSPCKAELQQEGEGTYYRQQSEKTTALLIFGVSAAMHPSPTKMEDNMVLEKLNYTEETTFTITGFTENQTLFLCPDMEAQNETDLTEFIILGFKNLQEAHLLLFNGFLITYLFTVLWNTFIVVMTLVDQRLRTPMYFFIGNLSFLDICYTTTTIPQMLAHLLSERSTISYMGCVLQVYFFFSFVGTECLLLAVMAFDRYVAICNPLRYTLIIGKEICLQLATACWAGGFLNSVVHTTFAFQLPFCGKNHLDAFYCDIPPLLKLSCRDTSLNQILLSIGLFIAWTPLLCILLSYTYIISTVLNMHSSEGRQKAFSTCSSHLTVVLLYYGSSIFTYLNSNNSHSSNHARLVSVIYTVLTPLLNPIIYTLRNKDVKKAWKSMIRKR